MYVEAKLNNHRGAINKIPTNWGAVDDAMKFCCYKN